MIGTYVAGDPVRSLLVHVCVPSLIHWQRCREREGGRPSSTPTDNHINCTVPTSVVRSASSWSYTAARSPSPSLLSPPSLPSRAHCSCACCCCLASAGQNGAGRMTGVFVGWVVVGRGMSRWRIGFDAVEGRPLDRLHFTNHCTQPHSVVSSPGPKGRPRRERGGAASYRWMWVWRCGPSIRMCRRGQAAAGVL